MLAIILHFYLTFQYIFRWSKYYVAQINLSKINCIRKNRKKYEYWFVDVDIATSIRFHFDPLLCWVGSKLHQKWSIKNQPFDRKGLRFNPFWWDAGIGRFELILKSKSSRKTGRIHCQFLLHLSYTTLLYSLTLQYHRNNNNNNNNR